MMRMLCCADLHMTGYQLRRDSLYVRIPAHAAQLLARRYDLMPLLLPQALGWATEELRPDFVLIGGDIVDDGFSPTGEDELAQAVETIKKACGTIPVACLYGNHDGPQERFAARFGGLNWTHEIAGVRIIGLNSGSMDPEAEQESSRVALDHLRQSLASPQEQPIVVALHQWLWPTNVRGYSFARAEEALAWIENDLRVGLIISGHYHSGAYEMRRGRHYCTVRAFAEPPFCVSLFDIEGRRIVWTEYGWAEKAQRFVPLAERKLPWPPD